MNLYEFVDQLHLSKPKTIQDIQTLGVKVKLVKMAKEGKFRTVYSVDGLDVIVKIPRPYKPRSGDSPEYNDPVIHSQKEINLIHRIMRERWLSHLRRYMPLVYYYNFDTGVVVMKRYRKCKHDKYKLQESTIVHMFRDTLGNQLGDYGRRNLRRDEEGHAKIVDLGY